jgi:hypothetical protein
MTRDQWCTVFVNYLVLRTEREVPAKLAKTIAASEWPTHSKVDPEVAAKAWVARRAASLKSGAPHRK